MIEVKRPSAHTCYDLQAIRISDIAPAFFQSGLRSNERLAEEVIHELGRPRAVIPKTCQAPEVVEIPASHTNQSENWRKNHDMLIPINFVK